MYSALNPQTALALQISCGTPMAVVLSQAPSSERNQRFVNNFVVRVKTGIQFGKVGNSCGHRESCIKEAKKEAQTAPMKPSSRDFPSERPQDIAPLKPPAPAGIPFFAVRLNGAYMD